MSLPYTVKLLDGDGCDLSVTEENSFAQAKRSAIDKTREAGYDDWAVAQVLDAQGEIIWDRHRSHCSTCGEAGRDTAECCGTDSFPEPGELREWA